MWSAKQDKRIEGVGVGLRSAYFSDLLSGESDIAWLEVLTDQFIGSQGLLLQRVLALSERYPVVMHGVGLSLGSTDPLNFEYLASVKALADRIKPAWISDHLAWVSHAQQYFHELLPLPYTEEVAAYIASRIRIVQDYLNYPVLIENVSSYLQCAQNTLTEVEFLNEVSEKANCGILLDINNVYVNSCNHEFDAAVYLKKIHLSRVKQIHLGGYTVSREVLVDTHSRPVYPAVWQCYQDFIRTAGPIPTCIEWDAELPTWNILKNECEKASAILQYYPAFLS